MENNHNNHVVSNGLKRRNSILSAVVIPQRLKSSPPILPNGYHHHNKLSSYSPSPPSADFELVSLKSSPTTTAAALYTSLKDIIPFSPSSVQSPTPAVVSSAVGASITSVSSGSGYEISIRNRLVKQAAWAYLQPAASSSPSSSSRHLFCFSGNFFRPIISRFRQSFSQTVTRVYDWLVDVLWLILCR